MIDDPLLRALVARLNAGGSCVGPTVHRPARRPKSSREEKWLRHFESLSKSSQDRLLNQLLPYAVERNQFGWLVTSPAGDQYQVTEDASHCSCGDHHYRGRKCKHMLMVEEGLGHE